MARAGHAVLSGAQKKAQARAKAKEAAKANAELGAYYEKKRGKMLSGLGSGTVLGGDERLGG